MYFLHHLTKMISTTTIRNTNYEDLLKVVIRNEFITYLFYLHPDYALP